MARITHSDLDDLADEINKLTGSPRAYSKNGKIKVGHYYVDCAYGGVKLVKIRDSGGAIIEVSHNGYGTKRELYNFMVGFINGLRNK